MFIRKDVLKLSIPIMIEQTFVVLLGVCNTMMAGYIGEEAVSAIGMVDTLNNIFISFFAALSVGATVVVAQSIGKGDNKKVNEVVRQAFVSGFIVSVIITIFMWIFRVTIINIFYGSATELVKENAKIYIEFTLITYPFIACEQIANGILRGCGDTKTPMKITMFMNIINIILGYLLIYGVSIGRLVIPSLGLEGAAIAIALARLIETIMVMVVLIKGINSIKLNRILPFKFDMKIQKNIFGIGIPAGVEQLLFNAGKFIVQIFIVTMGTVSIASNTIGMSIIQIPNVIGNSLTIAVTTLVGQYVGRDDIDGAKNVLMYLNNFATFCMVTLGFVFVIPFASFLAKLYTDNAEVINLSANLLKANSLAMIIWPSAFVLSAGLKGAGDTGYTMNTAIIGMWIFRVGIGYLLGVELNLGVMGVWIGMFLDWLIRAILYLLRLRGTKWIEHRIRG